MQRSGVRSPRRPPTSPRLTPSKSSPGGNAISRTPAESPEPLPTRRCSVDWELRSDWQAEGPPHLRPTRLRDGTMSVMKLTFWGAAGTVTGSMHLLESDGKRFLLDCGLFQGRRKDTDLKNRNLPFPGDSIDAVVLSHAHIDHSGNLPTLVKNGFAGPIFSTPATIDFGD